MVGVNIIPEYYPWPWRQHMLGHALSSTWEEVLHRANTPSASLAGLAIWLLWYHFRGLGALLVPSTTVLVCDALIWERRFLFLIQLHLCLASFDFSLHPFHPTSPIPPPSQQSLRRSDYSASGSAGVFEPSGSLVRLWSVHSRGRDWWDQVTEREVETKRKTGSETKVRKRWTMKTNTALKAADLFDWLYLMAEICNKMDDV